jgi:hypothetical protein
MRLETLPLIVGILFALAGLALIADAAIPDGAMVRPERRRRPRPQRHLAGEGVLGLGIVLVGVALIGRDAWRYTTLDILAALILCVVGVVLNWRYVRGMMLGEASAPADDAGALASRPLPAATHPASPATPRAAVTPASSGDERTALPDAASAKPAGAERPPEARVQTR